MGTDILATGIFAKLNLGLFSPLSLQWLCFTVIWATDISSRDPKKEHDQEKTIKQPQKYSPNVNVP